MLLQLLDQVLLLHKLTSFWLMSNLDGSCVHNAAAFRGWLTMLTHRNDHILYLKASHEA